VSILGGIQPARTTWIPDGRIERWSHKRWVDTEDSSCWPIPILQVWKYVDRLPNSAGYFKGKRVYVRLASMDVRTR